MDGKVIPHEVLRSTNIFIIVYILIFAGSIFLIAFDDLDLDYKLYCSCSNL